MKQFATWVVATLLMALGTTFAPAANASNISLAGTHWMLQVPAADSATGKLVITLNFDTEGRVTGKSGCNRYFAIYQLEGRQLRFDQLATTRRACSGAEGEQEVRFLDALRATTTFNMDGDSLNLRTDSGTLTVRLERIEQ